jgi:hypothetical protein
LTTSRDGRCAICDAAMPAGTVGYWNGPRKTLKCLACFETTTEGSRRLEDTAPPASSEIRRDEAGRSAQKEFEKRAAKEVARKEQAIQKDAEWRTEIRKKRPVLGRLFTVLTPKPKIGPLSQSTTAWDKGAAGERRVAEILEALAGIEVLHDRLVPGKGAANIDHVAVTASGVFVIDAKKYDGKLEIRNKGNVFRPDNRLYVAGRDRTKLIDGVLGQVESVRSVLGDDWSTVPVSGVLCFVGSEWPSMRAMTLSNVTMLWPKALPKHLTATGPFSGSTDAIASHLRRSLKQPK